MLTDPPIDLPTEPYGAHRAQMETALAIAQALTDILEHLVHHTPLPEVPPPIPPLKRSRWRLAGWHWGRTWHAE